MLWTLLIAALCYVIGSIPFPVIVSRLVRGIDLREHGSGNMGARNAARVLGKRWFPLVFGLDLAKGAAAAYLAQQLLPGLAGIDPVLAASIGGLMAVLGHCFPVLAGFKGGVGLAATGGALLVLSWPLLLTASTAILAGWALARNVHVGVAMASLLYPLLGWYWLRLPWPVAALTVWGAVIFLLHWRDLSHRLTGKRAA